MGNAKVWGRLVLGLLPAVGFTGIAWSQSQTVTPDQEYLQLIKVNQDIQPLGANPFGENISPYNGELSFDETDVNIPGNGPALVIARSLSTTSPLSYSFNAERPFGDWDLNIPRIETAVVAKIQGGYTGWVTHGLSPSNRCSSFSAPPTASAIQGGDPWESDQWWYGYHLIVPGAGSQDLLPRAQANTLAPAAGASTYGIVTKQNWMITCTAATAADDGGQGFIAVAPDGTQYTFTHLVYRPMTTLTEPLGTAPQSIKSIGIHPLVATSNLLERNDAFMYVTQVVDRFGNSLTYTYNNANGNLTGITASDGRSVTISYDSTGYLITSITAQAPNVAPQVPRTWNYSYDTSNTVLPSLKTVTLPDGKSTWSYGLAAFQTTPIEMTVEGDCSQNKPGTVTQATVTGTVTHPSGLTGTFTLTVMPHGRSYVPKACWGPAGAGSDLQFYSYPEVYFQPTITSKSFSGAGVATENWTYNYSAPNQSSNADACYSSGTCASTVYTDVVDPNGNDVRYTYSNRFDATEGQLLSTTYYAGGAGGAVLRTETNTYANPTGGPWPSQYGQDLQGRNNWWQTQEVAPLQMRQTQEEGDTYTWQALAYDAYTHPTDVKRFNSIAGQQSIDETTNYLNDPNLWVLGLPQTVVNNTTNETEIANTYNSQDLLQSRSRFGEFLMSYTYNSAGQLASFTDGNSHTTTLSNYYRGVPQLINYPDNTHISVAADDFGQIVQYIDQIGDRTEYIYDPLRRVTFVDYPTGDSWCGKSIAYNYVTTAERGIPAGHWDRTTTVCNAVTTTYFDTKLRPILTDASNSNQDITTATSYDWTGATTFASYPVYGAPDITSVTTGAHHVYDALERETLTQEDSELGLLSTSTAYLEGAGKQVTDPKNNVTTTYYQVFDEAEYKSPIVVNAPAGVTQTVARDIYGNPTSITQSGAYGSENDSIAKTLMYDSYHRLCRTTEPESGSTVMAYDAANNLAWSAQGQAITDGTCGQSDVASAAQTVRTYDAMNRVLTITPPTGTQSTSYFYDERGNVYNVTSGSVTQTFGYNSLNLLSSQTLAVAGSGYTWGIAYNYDGNQHINAIGYPAYGGASEGVAYNPDAFGRATQVGSYASGITYFPNGQVAGFNYGNGASYVAQQNARQLLSNFSYGVGSSLNISEDLSYDNNGNITNVGDLLNNGQRSKAFSYDALNRLSTATAANLYGAETYSYDALNNLRTRLTAGNTLTFNYDASNHLASVAQGGNLVTQYGYDAQGNRNSLTSAGTTTNYNFDAENQLLQVPGLESYVYDASGRRVSKIAATTGATSYYFYDQAGQLMYEFDPSAGTGTNYIYLGTKLIAKHVIPELALPGAITPSSNPNNGSFTLSWGAVPGATSYTLQEDTRGGTWNTIYSGSIAAASISGRTGGTYLYRVQACTSTGCGAWTTSSDVGVWPTIPTSITVPSGTVNGTYTISWAASVGASADDSLHYTLQESLNGGAWTTAGTTGTTSMTRPGTTTGTYTYRVQAFNGWGTEGWSATSAAVNVNTAYGVVPTPSPTFSVPATNNTGTQVISWTASSPVTAYTLQQSTNYGSSWTTVYSGTNTSTTLTNLQSGTYIYQLQACNNAGGGMACTPWAESGAMVVTIPPNSAPALSLPTGVVNDGAYTVSWGTVAAAAGYNFQQQVNGGGWSNILQGTTATSWAASGEADGTYGYRVQACNAGGCGPWSGTGTVTVDYPPASAPSLGGGGTSNTGSYSLSWSAVANATSYALLQSTNGGSAWTQVQSGTATSWSVSGQGNGSYIYMVIACDAGGCSAWSNQVTETVTLVPAVPAPSLSMAYSGGNKYTEHVTWAAVPTATSYVLQIQTKQGASSPITDTYTQTATTWSQLYTTQTNFSARVQACNGSGCSAWSQWYGASIP